MDLVVLPKGSFVSGLERPGIISGLEPFDILYWAGNVSDRSNRTDPKPI
jgi:hypothetical protein